MISVVTWVWHGPRAYGPEHANILRRMVARNLRVPHRFICVTDSKDGFDPEVEVVPMPAAANALRNVRTPESGLMPSCYRRLWVFSEEAKSLGERILLLDVDLVVVNDLTPLVDRSEDFVGWRPRKAWGNTNRVAGGMYLLTTGAHTRVWTDFNAAGIKAARSAGFRGSDQAWLSYKLGETAALWPADAGLYAVSDLREFGNVVPQDARIIQFAGHAKPWHHKEVSWVKEHYR